MPDNKDVRAEITKLRSSPDSRDHIKAAILDAEYTQAQHDGTAEFDPDFIAWKVRGGGL